MYTVALYRHVGKTGSRIRNRPVPNRETLTQMMSDAHRNIN